MDRWAIVTRIQIRLKFSCVIANNLLVLHNRLGLTPTQPCSSSANHYFVHFVKITKNHFTTVHYDDLSLSLTLRLGSVL